MTAIRHLAPDDHVEEEKLKRASRAVDCSGATRGAA